MADTKKRDYFATGDSDEEELGYDSEVEESKGKSFAGRSSKRRKLSDDELDGEEDESDNEGTTSFETATESLGNREDVEEADIHDATEPTAADLEVKATTLAKDRAKATKKLAAAQKKVSKTGVLYISRVPPFMKPNTLKNLLKGFAPSGLERVFLTPEDPTKHKSRVKLGGNKKKQFLDGWIEFVSKKEAKLAADTLNGQNIGGKKGNYYYDDVWNLKYLKGFKWRHLTEQIANENAERDARLRAENVRERKETKEFLRNVERSKMLDGMEKKRKAKGGGKKDGHDLEQQAEDRPKKSREKIMFRQSEAVDKVKKRNEAPSADAQRVLSKIF
jgi:ESF2/ABP1 family protein